MISLIISLGTGLCGRAANDSACDWTTTEENETLRQLPALLQSVLPSTQASSETLHDSLSHMNDKQNDTRDEALNEAHSISNRQSTERIRFFSYAMSIQNYQFWSTTKPLTHHFIILMIQLTKI